MKLHLGDASWFEKYHNGAEIEAYSKELAAEFPQLCSFEQEIGKSIEGRSIFAVRITDGASRNETKKIWLNGGQHAREWISPATVMFIIDSLLRGFGNDNEITNLLKTTEFIIVPLVNPDGYEYTWTNERLWRKNRRVNGGTSYRGVDLNRNWGNHWGGSGSSSSPSSDTYRGTAPFSEPETKSVSDYILTFPNIVGGIDIHSYSQLVLRPWGWDSSKPNDYNQLKKLGDGMSAAIKQVHGMDYSSIAAYELYYASGISSDWLYGDARMMGYCIELRDTGRYGFILPPDQIIPTGQETLAAVMYFAKALV